MRSISAFFVRCALTVLLGAAAISLHASDEPWDLWREAHDNQQTAERLLRNGNLAGAGEMFQRARDNYNLVKSARPDWNMELIDSRIRVCTENLEKIDAASGRSTQRPAAESSVQRPVPVRPEPAPAAVSDDPDGYKERYFRAMLELDNMRKELESARASTAEITSLLSEKQALQEQFTLLQEQYRDLKEKNQYPNTEVQEMKNRLLEAQITADDAVRRLNSLTEKYNQLNDEYNQAAQNRNSLRIENQQLKEKVSAYERSEAQSTRNFSAERERAARAEAEIASLENEISEMKKSIARQREENQTLTEALANASTDDTGLADELKRLQSRYEELEKDYLNMNSENRKLSASLRDMRLEATRTGETLQRIQNSNRDLQNRLEALQERFDTVSLSLDLSENDKRSAETRAANLELEAEELRSRASTLETRLKTREEGQLLVDREHEAAVTRLREEMSTLRLELASAQGKVKSLDDALESEKRKNFELRSDYIDLKAAQMNLSLELEQASAFRDRCGELETALSELSGEKDSLLEKIAALESRPAVLPVAVDPAPAAAPEGIVFTPTDEVGRLTAEISAPEKLAARLEAARKAAAEDFSELAVLEYQRLLKLDPENLDGNRELGRLYASENRFADAEPFLLKAHELAPEDPEIAVDCISALAVLGRGDQAMDMYDAMKSVLPDQPRLRLAAARAMASGSRWTEAAELYESIAGENEFTPRTRSEYARVLLALDRNDEAAAVYEAARQDGAAADPAVEDALGMRLNSNRELCSFLENAADEAFARGNWDSVIWYAVKLVDMEPGNERHYLDWAFAAIALGKGDEAAAAIAQAAARNTNPTTQSRIRRMILAGGAELCRREMIRASEELSSALEVMAETPPEFPERYAALPELFDGIIAELRRQPSLSSAEIDTAEALIRRIFPGDDDDASESQ